MNRMRRHHSLTPHRPAGRRAGRAVAGLVGGLLLVGCGSQGPEMVDLGTVGPASSAGAATAPPAGDRTGGSDASELPPEEQPLTRIEGGVPDDLIASGLLLPDFTPTYGEYGPVSGDGVVSVVQGVAPGELEEMTATCRDIAIAAGWTVTSEYEFGVNTGFMAEQDGDQLHYMLAEREGGGLDIRIEIVLF
jgi:hypothetical protein